MGLKPHAACWFEVIAARHDLSRVAEALARTGLVQIESEQAGEIAEPRELGAELRAFDALERRYHPYWPESDVGAPAEARAPDEVVARALEHLYDWRVDADPLIERLQALEHELGELELLGELVAASRGDFPSPRAVGAAGPTLSARVFVLAKSELAKLELPPGALVRRVLGERHAFLLVVHASAQARAAEQVLSAIKARPLELPSWLAARAPEALAQIDARRDALAAERARLELDLAVVHVDHELGCALGDLRRLRWFVSNVPLLPQTRHFAVATGWTSDPDGAVLHAALERSGVPALLHFLPAPAGRTPPVVLHNARWVRPFETFAGLLGTPAEHEPDPSPLLAVIAPLLFGFMFGDVGQGVVLIVAGLALTKRVPVLKLLIPGGLAAIAFGFAFGSAFALDNVMPALWAHPLSAPLDVLIVSVLAGAAILLLGLALGGVQAAWRGAFARWLETDAALIVVYLGLLGLLIDWRSALFALAGVAWHIAGNGLSAKLHRVRAAFAAAGHLVERVLQLAVNTVSFARVGAFALAHAGLSAAIVALAHAAHHPASAAAVLVVGNLLVLALEGLVVSIQTTRLVLFEFFVRFLRGEGRAFRPLSPPPTFGPPAASQGAP